jgi:hypothetical protein
MIHPYRIHPRRMHPRVRESPAATNPCPRHDVPSSHQSIPTRMGEPNRREAISQHEAICMWLSSSNPSGVQLRQSTCAQHQPSRAPPATPSTSRLLTGRCGSARQQRHQQHQTSQLSTQNLMRYHNTFGETVRGRRRPLDTSSLLPKPGLGTVNQRNAGMAATSCV